MTWSRVRLFAFCVATIAFLWGGRASAQTGTISGHVTDASNGTPLAGRTIQVFDSSGTQVTTASTDGTGAYTTIGLTTGNYFLRTLAHFCCSPQSAFDLDKLYNDTFCWEVCTVTDGTPVAVVAGSDHGGIDLRWIEVRSCPGP